MCIPGFTGHKTQVCQVADLTPGQRYRTPNGEEYLVMAERYLDPLVTVVDLATGEVVGVDPSTKLGHDQAGRLYASRSLNPAPKLSDTATVVE